MTLQSTITAQYGVRVYKSSSRLKRLKIQLANAKNRTLFLERCIFHKIIPKSFKNRCPIKSRRAFRLTYNYQLAILRETLTLARRKINITKKEIDKLDCNLHLILSEELYNTVNRITEDSYKKAYKKEKKELKDKFEKIKNAQKPTKPTPSRPSTLKTAVLQRQTEPLPPEAGNHRVRGERRARTRTEWQKRIGMPITTPSYQHSQKHQRTQI